MDGQTGLLIFYIVFGFLAFIIITIGIVMLVLWNRRKLIFTNFLSSNGQWERQSWKPNKIEKTFVYENETYEYDIKKCTRDKLNRPIAHYYKGNPKQQLFDFSKGNKIIEIGTENFTGKDFMVLMTSKVLKDIFSDDEVMSWLMIIFFTVIGCAIVIIIINFAYNPAVTLNSDNETINIIAQGVKMAITNKV